MTYITARFGVPVARPRVTAPARPRMTEAEMGKAMADLAASEQHRPGLPAQFPRIAIKRTISETDYAAMHVAILAALETGPKSNNEFRTILSRGKYVVDEALRQLAVLGRVAYSGKRKKWRLND
jgi:hypothetical protein